MNSSINGLYPRVSLGFAQRTDAVLVIFARNVLAMMLGNTNYPTPVPSLTNLDATATAFEVAVQQAVDGGKIAIATRNAARVELLSMLRQLASYVQCTCNKEVTTLLSSGFDAVRAPSPVGPVSVPQNPRLSLGERSGELLFRFERVKNARNYSVQTATGASGPWQDWDLSTSSRVTITGLTPGQIYWARVCANGALGPSGWSASTSSMAV